MTRFEKLLGFVYPPYRHKVLKQELTKLVNAIIDDLPNDFNHLKDQRSKTNLLFLTEWELFPEFKFMTTSFPGTTLDEFKKRGQNYRLHGQKLFSTKENNYVDVELIVHDNYLAGLRIQKSDYQLDEFDLSKIDSTVVIKTPMSFPPSDIELFYERLDDDLKSRLNPDDIFDIDFGNRTYYAFYDMEDGNYLATDKKSNVYSLVHDARPMAKRLKYSLKDILGEIETNSFDKDKHLESRYKSKA